MDGLRFRSQKEKHELSHLYEAKIKNMGNAGRNGGDRNNLADQAYSEFNEYAAFEDKAMVRIEPAEVRQAGRVPKNASIFFTIFQTFMSGKGEDGKPKPYFGEYPADFFDFIVIDECHRGGANDESTWRDIMDYFSPAVQLGLTATPKREINADTYAYFGDPVFIYSLKDGINDGFLTPFKVKQIATTLDDYVYMPDDEVVEGEIEEGQRYREDEFNRIIEIKERERYRVKLFMEAMDRTRKDDRLLRDPGPRRCRARSCQSDENQPRSRTIARA